MSRSDAASNQVSVLTTSAPSPTFERFAGACGVLSGIGLVVSGLAYLLENPEFSFGALTVSGVLTVAGLLGVFARLRPVDEWFALLGLMFGTIGAVGAMLHGGFDLALTLSEASPTPADMPSPTDPRGLLAGAVAGLGTLTFGWLITRGGPFPRPLGLLAGASGALLVLLYLVRLFELDPNEPILRVPALVSGVLVSATFLWLGLCLLRFAQGRVPN
jgi:hypothetical protein